MRRLVIRPGAIGDTIVSLPAVEHLCSAAEGVGSAEIWAPERNLPLLRHIAPVRSFSSVQLDLLELERSPAPVARLRGFDEIVSWYGAAREEFRVALEACGVPFRLLRALPPQGVECHAVDYYLRQVGVQPNPSTPIAPRLHFPAPQHIRDYIAIHPFSGSLKKNWDLALFQAVAEQLSRASGLTVEWCAGPDEDLPGARRFEGLASLAAYLSGAALYLGNDSGVTHLAAACGVPAVAIFQASDVSVWAPRGPLVAVLESPEVREVIDIALELLGL